MNSRASLAVPLSILLATVALLAVSRRTGEPKPVTASLVRQAPAVPPVLVVQDREITGTVFIVTRGAAVLKLAAVEIKVVEWKDVNDRMAKERDSLNKLIIETMAEFDLLFEQYDREFAAGKPAFDALDNARINTAKLPASKGNAIVEPFRLRAVAASAPATATLAQIESKQAVLTHFRTWKRTGETAFRSLHWPGVIRTTVTGPDGSFKLLVPSDRQVVLVAQAKRLVGGDNEEYFWVVTVAPADHGPVHLSTANLLNK